MNEPLHYQCPQCGHTVAVGEEMIGQAVPCPSCQHPLRFEIAEAIPVPDPPPGDEVFALGVDAEEATQPSMETDIDVRHPAMFRAHPFRWLLLVGALACGVWGAIHFGRTGQDVGLYGSLAVAVAAALFLGYWWLANRNEVLRITTIRTIYRKGIVSRETTEVRHDDVRNLQLDQSAPERIMGVGKIAISSAGQDGLEIQVVDIPRPTGVVEEIRARQAAT